MVQGPCRGKACDFWARARLKQATIEELVERISQDMVQCTEGEHAMDFVIERYWKEFGLGSLERLRTEEPELFEKVGQVSMRVNSRVGKKKHD